MSVYYDSLNGDVAGQQAHSAPVSTMLKVKLHWVNGLFHRALNVEVYFFKSYQNYPDSVNNATWFDPLSSSFCKRVGLASQENLPCMSPQHSQLSR